MGLDQVGSLFDVTYDDLDVRAVGYVTSIAPCGEIVTGDGPVVIGRFITRDEPSVPDCLRSQLAFRLPAGCCVDR